MSDSKIDQLPLTSTHWGTYRVERDEYGVKALHGFEHDPDPSPIGQGILNVLDGPTRIKQPMIREGWLKEGPGASSERRGDDAYVAVSWDEAEDLVVNELQRVSETYGNESIYGGSYGWASAGRFHHAQSQLHRFLNVIGGYTRSVNSYSLAAGEVILPHVLGGSAEYLHDQTSWSSIVKSTELLVAFGGMPLRNGQISSGGLGRHRAREALFEAAKKGVDMINISPLKSDVSDDLGAQWIAPRPGTDVSLMLAIAHTLLIENRHDRSFLSRCTTGFDQFSDYLLGKRDQQVKSAEWAQEITQVSADAIRDLARRMATHRTMISVSWSLTRQEFGEQPFWMATTLAAMLGQIGLPGGGVAFGLSAANSVALERKKLPFAAFPQKNNPVSQFIPVARITNMLLNPGQRFDYNGGVYQYPDIKLVYWAGGNPFHHHQDLRQLKQAWSKPDTVIAHEWCWNGLAKHADIVLPCTVAMERTDLMMSPRDPYIVFMEQVSEPVGESRDDYDIFVALAKKMGLEMSFSDNKTSSQWLAWLHDESQKRCAAAGESLPSYEALKKQGYHWVEPPSEPKDMLSDFRSDPVRHALATPSGKIEIFSTTIESYSYSDCGPHPAWYPPLEWLGAEKAKSSYPLHLISNQPCGKLHSQLDHGKYSQSLKINGREPVLIHVENAKQRSIAMHDLVRVFNDRGSCLAVAVISDDIRQDVIQLSTGAWLDAVELSDGSMMCAHGNPNMMTQDKGTSSLAQGPSAHSCLVNVEKYTDLAPVMRAFEPPVIR